MNPLSAVTIWTRVILASALYACEIWGRLSPPDIQTLERGQRHFARYIQSMDKYSPIEVTVSSLGMMSMCGYIDKQKLLFLGRLCRTGTELFHKQLFLSQITQYHMGFKNICNTTLSLIETLQKYELNQFLTDYINSGIFPTKKCWLVIVNNAVWEYEERMWTERLSSRTELSRYLSVHSTLTGHIIWKLCYLYPNGQKYLGLLHKILCTPIQNGHCEACDSEYDDIMKHYLLSCEKYVDKRNIMLERIVDIVPVNDSEHSKPR